MSRFSARPFPSARNVPDLFGEETDRIAHAHCHGTYHQIELDAAVHVPTGDNHKTVESGITKLNTIAIFEDSV